MLLELSPFLYNTNLLIIWYFLLVNMCYVVLLIESIPDVFIKFKESEIGNIDLFVNSNLLPPICILIPAYNEEDVIINTVQSVLKSNYPSLQIIIVNDGSSDSTVQLLHDKYELTPSQPVFAPKIKTKASFADYFTSKIYPHLQVIDKEHSGKSDSLNIGINSCSSPLFMTVDADTLLEPDAISKLAYSMLSQPHTIAEGGAIYVVNGCNYDDGVLFEPRMSISPLVAIQTCEYLRAFVFGRTGWQRLRGPLILSGAVTLLERQAVIDIGGFTLDAPGEDMEVIVGLHDYMRKNKFPYRIGYNLSASAWTHVPTDMNTLWSQRDRWHRGLIDSLMRHKHMFFNPSYGGTGLLSYPFQVLVEFLGPIVELIGYIAVSLAMHYNVINWQIAILFFVVTWGFASLMTLVTTLIVFISFNNYKRFADLFFVFFVVIFESCGYRQIMALCRCSATARYFLKKLIPV